MTCWFFTYYMLFTCAWIFIPLGIPHKYTPSPTTSPVTCKIYQDIRIKDLNPVTLKMVHTLNINYVVL